jgi:hypothetical protein
MAMTPSKTDLARALAWVTRLALLTSGGRQPPSQEQLGLYALTLATEMPAHCLTDASLSVIANGCEYFPAFSVLKTGLEGWIVERQAIAGARGIEMPAIVLERIMDGCNGQPGPKLAAWLNGKGVWPDDRGVWPGSVRVTAERVEAVRDWSDPGKIAAALRGLRGHPREAMLTGMLHGLVSRHAPGNLHLFDAVRLPVPVDFPSPDDAIVIDGGLFGEG